MRVVAIIKGHPVLAYFILVYGISWGGVALVWPAIAASGVPALLGLLFLFVPVAAGPSMASLVLTGLVDGKRGYRELIRRLTHWRVAPRWYMAALLINPVVLVVLFGMLSMFSPAFAPRILVAPDPLGTIGVAVAVGLGAGLFEELGWTGFATPRLLQRWSVVSTGLFIGLLWSAWHIAADIVGAAPEWGALEPLRVLTWMFAGMTPYRILMTWVYRHTESLFLAVFMHVAYTGVQRLLEPVQATQTESIMWWALLGLGLWLVVGVVMLADRLHVFQRPATTALSTPAYAR